MECPLIPFFIAFNLRFASTEKPPIFVAKDISKVLLAPTTGTAVLESCDPWTSPLGDDYPSRIQPMKITTFIWTCKADHTKNVLMIPYNPTKFVVGNLTEYKGDVLILLHMSVCHNGYYMRITAKLWTAEKELNNASMVANLDRIHQYNYVPIEEKNAWFFFNLTKKYKLSPGEHTLHLDLEVITTAKAGPVSDIVNLVETAYSYRSPVLTVEKTKLDPDEITKCTAVAYPAVEGMEWECDSGNWNAKEASISIKDPGKHNCRCSAFNMIHGKKFKETWSGTLEIKGEVKPSSPAGGGDDTNVETSDGMGLQVQKIIIMLQVWSLLALLLPD